MFPDLTLFVYANVRQEQVLDRKGRNEERRLLAAIQELAEESACLGWASEFSRSHDAFKELMKKVKRWKKKRRLIPLLTDRYKRKLLEFFSTYDQTEDSEKTLLNLSFSHQPIFPGSSQFMFLTHCGGQFLLSSD
uniref:Uncharacterized protein n=1 Tax=Aegilops tauschii subsp. strangulata TaxID=200361 RepID=A0A453B8T2_AEGTS